MKKRKILRIAAAVMVLALVLGCGFYVSDVYPGDEIAAAAMAGSETVTVSVADGMSVFAPENPEVGFLFYPGGKVEYTAYAPLMLTLAEQGVLCVLLEMPFNLAVLDVDAAQGIPEQFPEIKCWYLGGHSLGGSMAASFAGEQGADYAGLVLLAAYSTADLSDTGLRVLSLYGTEDGVLNREKYESCRSNLPETAVETVIQGGNHANFGSYGPQEGDGEASLSSQEQTRIAAEEILDFFASGMNTGR